MVPVSMKVATSTSELLAVVASAIPSKPRIVVPWAESGAAATVAVDAIGFGVEGTDPVVVTVMVVLPTTVDPVVP
jgi:hypothetical protein